MPESRPLSPLAELLPGSWRVVATSFPLWLTGRRVSPVFNYALRSTAPLALDDTVSWFTRSGTERSLVGVDRATESGLRWRGRGLLALFASDWSVTGASAGEDVIGIRFAKTLATPAGVDVLVREESMIEDVSEEPLEWLGFTVDEVQSLTWLRDVL